MTQGSLQHFGQIFCPNHLAGILANLHPRTVEDTGYIELESKFLNADHVELSDAGLCSLRDKIGDLREGKHSIQFSYMHGDEDLEIFGEVSLQDGRIFWYDLSATTEDNEIRPVLFDSEEFNRDYLDR
jgi:hypothetical protein